MREVTEASRTGGRAVAARGEPPRRVPPVDVLVVDDDRRNIQAIEAALEGLEQRLVPASSGADALRRLLERDYAVILLDVHMPDMDGFETARFIRRHPRFQHTPIIFVTSYGQGEVDVLRGYALGAVDFLFKPILPEVLRAKVGAFVELQQRAAEIRRQAERLRDLEHRELERRLAAERQRWEAEALRRESRHKDEFLAMLAHELRNPLAPLVTGLELLRVRARGDAGTQRVLRSMGRQVDLLARLVDDTLEAARITEGKLTLRPEPVSLEEVAAQAVEIVQPLIQERRHRLDITPAAAPLRLVADGARLTQIIANLLNNAAQHTDPGGRIRLSWTREGDEAVVRVADNGPGLTPETLARVFEAFVQERSAARGLGLGLTLVDRLVRLHGGTVHAHSDGAGTGTEFEVRLPCGDPAAPASAALGCAVIPADLPADLPAAGEALNAVRSGARAAEALRVVIVEDDPDIREATYQLLESWGHTVAEAADGARGLELILAERPDVALVDIAMPGLDGHAVAERVLQALGDDAPRLVALSGYGRDEDRRRTREAGFDEHLVKPARAHELRQALEGTT